MPTGQWEPPDAGNAPDEVKRILRTVYAAYRDEHPAEDPEVKAKGAQIAWGAVRRAGWKKDDDGKWVKEVSNLSAIDNEGSFSHSSHDITLQRLDTLLPYSGTPSGKLKYSVDNFAGTEQAWDRTLAVFVPKGVPVQHVDHAAFANDPHCEAKRLGYRIAGSHMNTAVVNVSGTPQLDSEVIFTDPEAENAARLKQLSLSTGFDASIIPEGAISGKVVPNHVLYFYLNEPTACKKAPCPLAKPNDPGAGINNLSEETMADEDTKGILTQIRDAVTPKENPLQKTVDNLTAESTAKDAQIAALTKENESLKAAKISLDNLMAEQEKTRKDGQWAQIKNLYKPAMFHKPEDEKAARDAFEKDPVSFQLANIGNLATVKGQPAKGTEAIGNIGDPDAKIDMVAERGAYDPISHTFKGRQ